MDVSEELANRICARLNDFFNFKQFSQLLKTREMTRTRIDRALLHIMLGIKKRNVQEYMEGGYHFYSRLLGFRKNESRILLRDFEKEFAPSPLQTFRGQRAVGDRAQDAVSRSPRL